MKSYIFKGFLGIFLLLGLFAAPSANASNLTPQQAQAIIQMVQSFGADAATVSSVSAALGLSGYGYSYGYGGLYSGACPALSYNLYVGLSDAQTAGQVSMLQRYLGVVPTGYFGSQTQSAVVNFQTRYQIYPVTGGVGPLTRAKIVQLCGGSQYPYQYGTISITGVNGPNTLAVNQQGTWSVSTNAPSGSYVSLSVNWGDQNAYPYPSLANTGYTNQQNTFTHSYGYPGTYTIVFTATDNNGHSNSASATVVVGGGATCGAYSGHYCGAAPIMTSLSPTSGAVGTQVTIYGSGFTNDNIVHFGIGGAMHVASYNGTSLTFTIPSMVSGCDIIQTFAVCTQLVQQVTPGSYPMYISNNNGQSSTLYFNVTGVQSVGGLTVTAPMAGQTYYRGQDMQITWSYPVTPGSAQTALYLYTASGNNIGLIAVNNNTIGTYTWHIPGFPQNYMCTTQYPNALCGANIPTGQYYIKVTASADGLNPSATQYASGQSGIFTIIQQ